MDKKKILFLIIFTVFGLLAFQIQVNKIVGSGQSFTLFELLGPVGGMFLGPVLGAVSAFFVRALNVVLFHQKIDLLTVIRFLPAMLAAFYFGAKSKKTAIIFPICIALFLLNPVGRQAWMYSAIWLIPFTTSFFKKNLLLNSLGATFTAHAVGSVIFLYTFNLPASAWMGLIPVVFIERGVFTIGIWASTLVFNFALNKITDFKFASSFKSYVSNAN
jgi:hypothetical protein